MNGQPTQKTAFRAVCRQSGTKPLGPVATAAVKGVLKAFLGLQVELCHVARPGKGFTGALGGENRHFEGVA